MSETSSDLLEGMSLSASQRGPACDEPGEYEDDFHDDREPSIAEQWASEPQPQSPASSAPAPSTSSQQVPRMEVNRLLQERLERMKASALRRAHELPPATRNPPFVTAS